MERDSNKTPSGPDSPSAQTKSRFGSPLVISSASRRRSLFSLPRSAGNDATARDGDAEQAQALDTVSSDPKLGSPNQTKIPRPSQQRPSQVRPTFTLSDAYRMAEEEEEAAARGSPSPAPRAWRSRRDPVDGKLQKAPTPGSAESQRRITQANKPGEVRREDTASSVDSLGSQSRRSDVSGSYFDEKLRQHALEQTPDNSPQRGAGRFTKSRLGTKITETAKELVKKSSRNSLEGDSPSRSGKARLSGGWLSRQFSGRKTETGSQPLTKGLSSSEQDLKAARDEVFPSGAETLGRPATVPPDYHSPEKSFAWQADADFTAGDLQVSSSPPVVIGRSNTKIDEIRALEAEVIQPVSKTPPSQSRNTRLDEIRALEIETALKLNDDLSASIDPEDCTKESRAEKDDKLKQNWQPTSVGTKVDELRLREIETLSRRALATARLDEIRERHAGQQSRSPTPEPAKKLSKEPLRSISPGERGIPQKGIAENLEGPAVDEAVVLDASANERGTKDDEIEANNSESSEDSRSRRRVRQMRRDSRDLLRKLALATSTSPMPEQQAAPPSNATRDDTGTEQAATRLKKASNAKTDARPAVGFAGLKRDLSVESRSDKRSSFVHSDSDPTERIEGEMKLFAPMENHSERGSLRAPSPSSSPASEAGDVEETPRPLRTDPLTQPTPRVVGAFVETPATIKVDRFGDTATSGVPVPNQAASLPASNDSPPVAIDLDAVGKYIGTDNALGASASLDRGRKTTAASSRNPRVALSAKGDRTHGRSSSASARRRAKSLSRSRAPLINSVRPPTVKDDLLEIKRANQFDDSTLDDLAELLNNQDMDDVARLSGDVKVKTESASLSERQMLDRMSKSLETGLLGIRAAKQGIERLEDKVSHAETKETQTESKPASHMARGDGKKFSHPLRNDLTTATDNSMAYIQLPIPLLWHSRPSFRFTFWGLTLFLLSLWYIAETSMCRVYCKPQICYPGLPCDWSPDDPRWGYSIPMKLDDWLTGGHGRALIDQVRPGVSDWFAELWDAATGNDIARINVSHFSWEQKRQHRRRLAKRGLRWPSVERLEDKEKFAAWKAARLAKERTESLREMGYPVDDEDDSMAGDEAI